MAGFRWRGRRDAFARVVGFTLAVSPHSKEGDVRIYSEVEMRRTLGTWFSDVSWRRVGLTACVAIARKGA